MVLRFPRVFTFTRRRAEKLTHRNALARLKSLGFAPAVIYDIGAYRGGWTRVAAEVFPEAQFVLFEANGDHAPGADRTPGATSRARPSAIA